MSLEPNPTPTSTSNKWLILAVVGLVIVGVVVFAVLRTSGNANGNFSTNTNALQNTNGANNANRTANVNAASNTNSTPLPAGWQPYGNTEFGFGLAFPPDWEGYIVSTFRRMNRITNEPVEYTTVVFQHPRTTSSDGRPGKVELTIYVFNADSTIPQGVTLLDESGDRRFGYSRSNAAAPGELEALWNEMTAIVETFRLQR